MSRTRKIQQSFHSGELTPLGWGRTDIERYDSAVERLENFVITPQGGVERRPGTIYVGDSAIAGSKSRLVRFEFSTIQAYVIEFSELKARFFINNGIIESTPGTPLEVVTPYTQSQLKELSFTQSADYLYIVHPSHPPRKLTRTSHVDWTLSAIEFTDGPYCDINKSETLTLTLSALTGTGVTMTASSALFNELHVGSIWRIEAASASKNNEWVAATVYASGARVVSGGRIYESTGAGTSGSRKPTHTIGTESDGTVNWAWKHNGFGYVKVTGYTSKTVVTVAVVKDLPNSVTSGTLQWREGAWSDYRGWPATVTFYKERLVFGGNSSQPQTCWFSCTNDFEKFSPTDRIATVLDTNAITVTLASSTVNSITWMVGADDLVVGTIGGEWVISAASTSKAISPDNIEAVNQTNYGSAQYVPAIRIGTGTLFVERSARRLRELLFSFEVDNYKANDVSVLGEHLLREGGGVVDVAYQNAPHSVWWGVRADGKLIGCTYLREQNIIGWHQHSLGGDGFIESVCCIPSSDGSHDQLWMVVKRTINGAEKRYIEVMSPYFHPESETDSTGMWFLDCALEYSGSAATTILGLSHLEGKTVGVLADYSVHPNEVVASGAITLESSASKAIVGLSYESNLTTLPVDFSGRMGAQTGQSVRIHRAEVFLINSLEMSYGAGKTATHDENFRTPEDPMSQRPPFFTGYKTVFVDSNYSRTGQFTITQSKPYPLNIVSTIFEAGAYDI